MLTFICVWCIIILVRNKKTKHQTRMKEKTKMKNIFTSAKSLKVETYDECKYTAKEEGRTIIYHHVVAFEVVTEQKEVEEIEASGMVDEYHEYLVLYFEDGTIATFRNSHVDMFELRK